MRRFIIVILLLIASVMPAFGTTQTINTIPSSNATFISDLQTFLRGEISDRSFRGASGVMYGGIGATDASLTHTINALVAFPDGYYVSQAATSRTYTATTRTYVYVRKDSAVTVTIAGAAITYGTNIVYAEMAAATAQPSTPANIIPLFYADTNGTSITAVTDLRTGRASLAYWDTLSAALTAIGTSLKMTLVVSERYVIAATIDASTYTNIKYDMLEASGSFNVLSTFTLTFPSPFHIIASPNQQIFSGAGTLAFNTGGMVYPDWWGENTSPGTTDMEAKIESADTSLGSNKGTIGFTTGQYASAGDITFDSAVYLDFKYGSMISPATGKVITIACPSNIVAQKNVQIFSGAGTVAFGTFGGGIYAAWWGCKGDGSTNDATTFQAMLNAKPAGFTPIDLLGKTYRIDSALTLPDKIKLFNGKIDFSNAGDADLFTCTGTVGTGLVLTSNVAVNDNHVDMAALDAATLAAGDYIWLESAGVWSSTYGATLGEQHRVSTIAATVVNLSDTVVSSYLTADTATVSKFSFKENIEFDNLELWGDGTSSQRVAWFKYCRNVIVNRCISRKFYNDHWRFLTSRDVTVRNCSIYHSKNTGLGYGVVITEGTQFYHIDNNFIEYCDVGIDAGGGTRGVCRYGTANFNEIVGCDGSAIQTHSTSEFLEIRGNRINHGISTAVDGYGIQIRSVSCIIDGNQINHSGVAGIYIANQVDNMGGDRRCYYKITNNTFDYPTQRGIYVYLSYDIIYRDISIIGNAVYHSDGGTAIEVRLNNGTVLGVNIANNTVLDQEGATFNCLKIQAPTDDYITLVNITGNTFYRLDDLDNNIELIGNATHKILYVTITGNNIVNGLYGIFGQQVDYAIIMGNVIHSMATADMSAMTDGNLGANSFGNTGAAHVTDVHNN